MGWDLFAMKFAKFGNFHLPFVCPHYTKSRNQKIISFIPHFKNYVLKVEANMYINRTMDRKNVVGFINAFMGCVVFSGTHFKGG